MKIRFTPLARIQFLSGLSYIQRNNPKAAVQFYQKTAKVLRRLEKFPNSGRRIPEFPEILYREIIIIPYRFFYHTKGKTIWIISVWHTGQIPKEKA